MSHCILIQACLSEDPNPMEVANSLHAVDEQVINVSDYNFTCNLNR